MLILSRYELVTKYNTTFWAMRKLLHSYGLNFRHTRLEKYPIILTDEQEDLVIGTMLGDGSIHKNGSFRFGQSLAHKTYVEHVAKVMQPFTNEVVPGLTNMGYPAYYVYSTCHPLFKRLEKEWYVLDDNTQKRRKVVPTSLVLNKRRIAYWAMDDGSNDQERRRFKFCTHGFTPSEVEFLVDKVNKTTGFSFYQTKNRSQGDQHVIFVSMSNYFEFLKYLASEITIPCMLHKVDTTNAPSPDMAYAGKLNQQKANEIRGLYFYRGLARAELARQFGVAWHTIDKIVNNVRYPDDDFYIELRLTRQFTLNLLKC